MPQPSRPGDTLTRALFRWGALGCRVAAALVASATIFCACPARAQPPAGCPPVPSEPTAEELQALGQGARDRGFLWRVSKDERTSWLYGTIHVARRDWAFPGPRVSAALREVDTVALEIDPMSPDIQQALARSLAGLHRPTLPPALAQRLARQARDDCLPEAPFAAMAPSARTMVLTTLVGRRDGLDPAYGIDGVLAAFGHARSLDVASLESPAEQMTALDTGSDDETVAWIDGSLGDIERGTAREQLARLASAWADGDLQALSTYQTWCHCVESDADRALMRRVLDDRNPGLAAAIDALHARGRRVFAAVGSLHMTGPLGLPALLAARGYAVERIDLGAP